MKFGLLFLAHDTYLTNAAACGCQKCVRHLVKYGISINDKSITDISPVQRAVTNKRVQMIKYLVKLGADMNVRLNGKSPLDIACLIECWDVTFLKGGG